MDDCYSIHAYLERNVNHSDEEHEPNREYPADDASGSYVGPICPKRDTAFCARLIVNEFARARVMWLGFAEVIVFINCG